MALSDLVPASSGAGTCRVATIHAQLLATDPAEADLLVQLLRHGSRVSSAQIAKDLSSPNPIAYPISRSTITTHRAGYCACALPATTSARAAA